MWFSTVGSFFLETQDEGTRLAAACSSAILIVIFQANFTIITIFANDVYRDVPVCACFKSFSVCIVNIIVNVARRGRIIVQILCVHIKRFHQSYDHCKKLADYVEFPLHDLDMSRYSHPGTWWFQLCEPQRKTRSHTVCL